MSVATPIQEHTGTAKPQRVLACVLCQQRKVKCDRKFPCVNCVRAGVQCVPATLVPRQRRRRFAERELLERLRQYEDLLRHNNIKFEPLHRSETAELASPSEEGGQPETPDDTHHERNDPKSDRLPRQKADAKRLKTVNLWRAMSQNQLSQSSGEDDQDDEDDAGFLQHMDDLREAVIKKAWDQTCMSDKHDQLLFGTARLDVDLSTFHPEQAQIFRLWQIYLDNINPLLKVMHTPTLQARIIDAATNITGISSVTSALLFSIYCTAILSLTEDECQTLFNSPKKDLMLRYQFACQQALLQSKFLGTKDRDCLTALYLYLICVRHEADPRSLSSMLGVAIRIAQRMGIHDEAYNKKYKVLEAEMRRRLWWSLVIFDSRVCEIVDHRTATTLGPSWDCRLPLNVNDFELRPEMKSPPAAQPGGRPTEAIFVVVRSELADFVRHSSFHLDLTTPPLKGIAKETSYGTVPLDGDDLLALEKTLEDRHLAFCSSDDPVHYLTIWMTRGYLARTRLLEHYSRHYLAWTGPQANAQRNIAVSYALTMLECDTKLASSPLTQRFLWLIHFHFPFPAYIHVLQDLKKRPAEDHAEKAWEIMSDNYETRSTHAPKRNDRPFFIIFARLVLQAWEAREALYTHDQQQQQQLSSPLRTPPRIVTAVQKKMSEIAANFLSQQSSSDFSDNPGLQLNPDGTVSFLDNDQPLPSTMDPSDLAVHGLGPGSQAHHEFLYGSCGILDPGSSSNSSGFGSFDYLDMSGQPGLADCEMSHQFEWNSLDYAPIPFRPTDK
ncbi:Transcriptional regulator AacuB [Exophiala dermatitidis]